MSDDKVKVKKGLTLKKIKKSKEMNPELIGIRMQALRLAYLYCDEKIFKKDKPDDKE